MKAWPRYRRKATNTPHSRRLTILEEREKFEKGRVLLFPFYFGIPLFCPSAEDHPQHTVKIE
jgi:hypothetical protein